mgnify:CR=1 FL=1
MIVAVGEAHGHIDPFPALGGDFVGAGLQLLGDERAVFFVGMGGFKGFPLPREWSADDPPASGAAGSAAAKAEAKANIDQILNNHDVIKAFTAQKTARLEQAKAEALAKALTKAQQTTMRHRRRDRQWSIR